MSMHMHMHLRRSPLIKFAFLYGYHYYSSDIKILCTCHFHKLCTYEQRYPYLRACASLMYLNVVQFDWYDPSSLTLNPMCEINATRFWVRVTLEASLAEIRSNWGWIKIALRAHPIQSSIHPPHKQTIVLRWEYK